MDTVENFKSVKSKFSFCLKNVLLVYYRVLGLSLKTLSAIFLHFFFLK